MFPRGERPTPGLRGKGWQRKRIEDYQRWNKMLAWGMFASLGVAGISGSATKNAIDTYKPTTIPIAVDKTDGTVCQIGRSTTQPTLPFEVTMDRVVSGYVQRCITMAREVPLKDDDVARNKDALYNGCLLKDAQTKMDTYYASKVNDKARDPAQRNDYETVDITARKCWPLSDKMDKEATLACEWTETTQGVQMRLPPTMIRWAATVNVVIDPSLAGDGSRLSEQYDNLFGIMIANIYSVHPVN